MSSDLSPQNEQFIEDSVASGAFPNRGEALNQAVDLLKQRLALLAHIDEGTRQLEAGEGIVLRGDGELRAFIEEIKADGLKHYLAKQAGQ